MMRIIDELATRELLPNGLMSGQGEVTLDFTVPVIDNYGDMGFAMSLAFEMLIRYPSLTIRFFSDDRGLFEKLVGKDHPLLQNWYSNNGILSRLQYGNLSEYAREMGLERYNFFGYGIPLAWLPGVSRIVNFDYLQFRSEGTFDRPASSSLHATCYFAGSTQVTHFVPGFVPGCGGITLPPLLDEEILKTKILNTNWKDIWNQGYIRDFYGIPQDRPICSIFVYEKTFLKIYDLLRSRKDWHFLVLGRNAVVVSENVQLLPFVPLALFRSVQSLCHRCVVRGENSLVCALESEKPFLWDIYPEKNGAHLEKMADLEKYLQNTDRKSQCDMGQVEYFFDQKSVQ